jgi:hypothetical protein
LWCKYPSTLVPGLLSTVLPLQLHIYIDDIKNIGHPV